MELSGLALYRLELKRHSRAAADVAARAAYRSGGRLLAAAAYRAGAVFELGDGRCRGRTIDYSRRYGVVDAFIEAPVDAPDWTAIRANSESDGAKTGWAGRSPSCRTPGYL